MRHRNSRTDICTTGETSCGSLASENEVGSTPRVSASGWIVAYLYKIVRKTIKITPLLSHASVGEEGRDRCAARYGISSLADV